MNHEEFSKDKFLSFLGGHFPERKKIDDKSINIIENWQGDGYRIKLIEYNSDEGDSIPHIYLYLIR